MSEFAMFPNADDRKSTDANQLACQIRSKILRGEITPGSKNNNFKTFNKLSADFAQMAARIHAAVGLHLNPAFPGGPQYKIGVESPAMGTRAAS